MKTDQIDSVRAVRSARAVGGTRRSRMGFRALLLGALVSVLAMTGIAADTAKDQRESVSKVQDSAKVVRDIMGAQDKAIPGSLLEDAACVAVFPNVIKGAFVVGGSGGSGCAVVRDTKTGQFGQPLFLKIGGGSVGFQIGGSSTDFLLVGVNRDSIDTLTKGSWTLGADAAVAAGPVGRSAKAGTDWKLDAQFLSYSRSKGVFAGVSLDGSKISIDKDRNSAIYGPSATPEEILSGKAKADVRFAKSLSALSTTLARYGQPKASAKR